MGWKGRIPGYMKATTIYPSNWAVAPGRKPIAISMRISGRSRGTGKTTRTTRMQSRIVAIGPFAPDGFPSPTRSVRSQLTGKRPADDLPPLESPLSRGEGAADGQGRQGPRGRGLPDRGARLDVHGRRGIGNASIARM